MKSLIITVLMFLTLSVGTKAQENQKVFTAEEQTIVDLSNNKWNWMAEKNVESWQSCFMRARSLFIWVAIGVSRRN